MKTTVSPWRRWVSGGGKILWAGENKTEEDREVGAAEVWVVSLARGSGHGQQVLACDRQVDRVQFHYIRCVTVWEMMKQVG